MAAGGITRRGVTGLDLVAPKKNGRATKAAMPPIRSFVEAARRANKEAEARNGTKGPAMLDGLLDQILLGDCAEMLRRVPDGSVDLVVSSPPYNLGKEYEARKALAVYLEEQRAVLTECTRVLAPTGSIFWQVGSYSEDGTIIPLDVRVFPMLEDLGLLPRNRIAWLRQHGVHARKKFSCRYETILWFTKSDDYPFNLDAIRVPQKYRNKKEWKGEKKGELTCNPLGKNPGDIWVFRNVKHNHEEQTIHPCQFPEDLIARIVLATTNPGGVVLDPYMGTGTVAVVAQRTQRHFLGAELDARYHAVAQRRLSGEPDENGQFPNLKTLRDYVERTGEPIDRFRFDKQVGNRATDRSKAKIFPEEHHIEELEARLAYEEECFSCDAQGRPRPPPRYASEIWVEPTAEQPALRSMPTRRSASRCRLPFLANAAAYKRAGIVIKGGKPVIAADDST